LLLTKYAANLNHLFMKQKLTRNDRALIAGGVYPHADYDVFQFWNFGAERSMTIAERAAAGNDDGDSLCTFVIDECAASIGPGKVDTFAALVGMARVLHIAREDIEVTSKRLAAYVQLAVSAAYVTWLVASNRSHSPLLYLSWATVHLPYEVRLPLPESLDEQLAVEGEDHTATNKNVLANLRSQLSITTVRLPQGVSNEPLFESDTNDHASKISSTAEDVRDGSRPADGEVVPVVNVTQDPAAGPTDVKV
jgi:hypothetical protein